MDIKQFVVSLYDLIAKNTEYKPREEIDYIISEHIDDYWVDSEMRGAVAIMFRGKDGKEYCLKLEEQE